MSNSKHKRGDKFILEIAEVHTHYTDKGKPYNCYRVKGFNTVMFDDYGLERFIFIGNSDNSNESVSKIDDLVREGIMISNKILEGEDNYD